MWETHFQMDNMNLPDIHLQLFRPWVCLFWNHYGKRILQHNLLMVLQVLHFHRTFSLGMSEVESFLLDNRSHSDISLHLSLVWLLLFLHCRSIQDHTDQSHLIDLQCKYHSDCDISVYLTIIGSWLAGICCVMDARGRLLSTNACLITLTFISLFTEMHFNGFIVSSAYIHNVWGMLMT